MDSAKPLSMNQSHPQAASKSFMQILRSQLLPIAKRLLISEIVDNHAVHLRAAATEAIEYTMQKTPAIPSHLTIPTWHGVVPLKSTTAVPRGGMEVPPMATTAPTPGAPNTLAQNAVSANPAPKESFMQKAESWLEHAGKVIASDLAKSDVVLKNVLPIAQFTATIFSFTPWGAVAAEIVQLVVMAEGTLAAAGQQTGTGPTVKLGIVTNSIGNLIEQALKDAGADSSANAVEKAISAVVGFLNGLDPAMFANLEKALTGNLQAA